MTIARAESQQADQIVRDLQESYQMSVVKDWGEGTEADPQAWRGGEWSLDELRTLQTGVADLAQAMGGPAKFVQNIGAIRISQVEMKHRGLASVHGIRFTASDISIDLWTVVHELAHVWDARSGWRLSKALESYTGGRTNWVAMLLKRARRQCDEQSRLPGCNRFGYFYGDVPPAGADRNFNRREDFAESVAAYVYPARVQGRVDRFKDDEGYRDLLYYADYTQTRRWAFVDGLVRGTIVVSGQRRQRISG
ncbi:MAG: hypothetical protein Kow0063_12660 [Anaerolineae bacterium]